VRAEAQPVNRPSRGGFATLLDGTFGLLGRTWATALACGAVVFLPAAVLYGWAWQRLFSAYADVFSAVAAAGVSPIAALGGMAVPMLVAALAQGLATMFVRACVTARAASALRGERVSPALTAGRVLRRFGARLLGQRALQGLLYAAVFTATVIAAVIGLAVAGGFRDGSASTGVAIALFIAFYLAGIAAWVWMWARYSFTLEAVVIDGARATQSFSLSASLVRRGWWRVFGNRLLFALMLGFAASLVATPIVFFATIKAYARYLAGILEGSADTDSLLEMIQTMGSGLPLRLAILVYLQGLLNAFFAPVFMTLLYIERKRRASEASAADPAEAAALRPPAPAVP
jgi:hypothetical protein